MYCSDFVLEPWQRHPVQLCRSDVGNAAVLVQDRIRPDPFQQGLLCVFGDSYFPAGDGQVLRPHSARCCPGGQSFMEGEGASGQDFWERRSSSHATILVQKPTSRAVLSTSWRGGVVAWWRGGVAVWRCRLSQG